MRLYIRFPSSHFLSKQRERKSEKEREKQREYISLSPADLFFDQIDESISQEFKRDLSFTQLWLIRFDEDLSNPRIGDFFLRIQIFFFPRRILVTPVCFLENWLEKLQPRLILVESSRIELI